MGHWASASATSERFQQPSFADRSKFDAERELAVVVVAVAPENIAADFAGLYICVPDAAEPTEA